MGAVGAMLLAAFHHTLTCDVVLAEHERRPMRLTAMVIYITRRRTVKQSLVFRGVDGELWIEDLLTSLPGGGWSGSFSSPMSSIFVLAFFFDFFEIAFIIVPLLAPVAAKLGIDLIWFGAIARSAPPCRPVSCTRRSASHCSICAA